MIDSNHRIELHCVKFVCEKQLSAADAIEKKDDIFYPTFLKI